MSGQVIFADGVVGEAWPELLAEGQAGGTLRVRLADGRLVQVPVDLVTSESVGHYRVAMRAADLVDGFSAPASAVATEVINPGDAGIVVPVVEEELRIGKREVETGRVRVIKTVQERTETIDEPLQRRTVEIRRFPVNKIVDAPPATRYEGSSWIVPVLEEVLVVEKRLMLVEEVHIVQSESEFHAPVDVTLRREEIEVKRVDVDFNDADRSSGAS